MGSFFRGVVKGAAKSLDKNITEQLAFLKSEASSVAKIRANRKIRDQEEYAATLKENSAIVEDLSIKVGGADNLQFLFDKYGTAEGKIRAEELYQHNRNTGGEFNITENLNLEKRKGTSISASDLARSMTSSISVDSGKEDYSELGTGLTRLLGQDPTKSIIKQSNRLMTAAGVPTDAKQFDASSVPSVLQGEGIPEWKLIYTGDSNKDAARLLAIATDTYSQSLTTRETGNIEKADSLLAKAREIQNASDKRRLQNDMETKPSTVLTSASANNYIANIQNSVQAKLNITKTSFEVRDGILNARYVDDATKRAQQVVIQTGTNQKILPFIRDAMEAGLSAADIRVGIDEATTRNRVPIVVRSEDYALSGEKPTIQFDQDEKVFDLDDNIFNLPATLGGNGLLSSTGDPKIDKIINAANIGMQQRTTASARQSYIQTQIGKINNTTMADDTKKNIIAQLEALLD